MKVFGLLLMTTLFLSCSNAQEKTEDKTDQTEEVVVTLVDKKAFSKLIKKEGAQLLDVRTPGEIAKGKIGDAAEMNFNAANFKSNLKTLNKDQPVLVYCASGGRSARAVVIMRNMGFKEIHELRGGYNAWIR